MGIEVEYNQRKIELDYAGNKYADMSKECVMCSGSSLDGNYQVAEEVAWSYLVIRASMKKPDKNLEKVIIINQDTDLEGEKVKITLIGVPVFTKNFSGEQNE